MGFCILGGFLRSRDPTFSVGQKKKHTHTFVKGSAGTPLTRVKNFRVSPKKGVNIRTFVQ